MSACMFVINVIAICSGAGSVWVALIGIISLLVMLLPLENESSSWPSWIHVTVSMKLMAAFVLG